MTMSTPHAGRGGGGRHYRKRGGRQGRGGGGRGGGQEGGRGKSSTPPNKAGDAAVVKQAKVVVVEKMNTENKSPQDPTPPTQSITFAKNVADLKKVLGVGVVETATSPASSGDTNNAGAKGVSSGTAADTPSEKEKMQQKLKEAREQVAAAKEKKKSKKSKKHEKWLREQQQQEEDRAKSWTDKVNREEEKCNTIPDLIGTEFRRVNTGAVIDEETQKVITEKSREAHDWPGDTNNAGAQGVSSGTAADTPSEKEKMQQKLKEAREQVAAAKEKKKSKKSKKHEKWLKEQQQQQEDRAKSWTDKVNREEEKCNTISDLIGTEFRRVNKGAIINEETQKVIIEKSREAHDALYGSNIKCRVEVVGLDKKDFNGRKGNIRHWDENKGQFCVGLDTKKSRDCDVHFFKPENLDVVTSAQSAGKKDGKLATNFIVSITGVTTQGGDDIGCQFSLEKSDIIKLEAANSRSKGLQEFLEERDALADRLMKEQEEQRKEEERLEKEEEEDRKRRAELRAKMRAEKELKKEEQRQKRQERAQMEWERKQAEAKMKAAEMMSEIQMTLQKAMLTQKFGRMYESYFRMWADDGGSLEDFEDFKEEFKERVVDVFVDIDDDDLFFELGVDDILEEIFNETDEKFKEVLVKDRLEENKKHAEILGVSHDVDKRTLQKTYRKLALQYHPDKWSTESAHGMSKEEAEEHFKNIRNSYDHLMANFDE